MKPTAITVSRFRGWKDEHRINLDAPITSIVAGNGRGKSSLLNAIEWCLYGAKVTKKGSGIDERQDWEIRSRVDKGDIEPTRVELELYTAGGLVKIRRERNATAKAREDDQLFIEDPNGNISSGEGAESRLHEVGIPDWETYRRAHCFHQEAARQRVISTNERTAILAALLGLDDDLALRNTIESYQPSKIFTDIDKALDALNEEAHRALELPRQRISGLEDQATDIGLNSSKLSESNAKILRSQLVVRARELARRLGLTADLPDENDVVAVRDWTAQWPTTARTSSPALSALDGLRRQVSQLELLIAKYEEAERSWQEVRSNLDLECQAKGDEAKRTTEVALTKSKLAEVTSALQQNNALVKLLVDAKSTIETTGKSDECPVCETSVPGLEERLHNTIDRLSSDEFQLLQAAEENARAAFGRAKSAQGVLQRLIVEEATAHARVDDQRDKIRELLETSGTTAVHDALAEAKKRLEKTRAEIENLERLASDRDKDIQNHQADWGRLNLIEKWLSAVEKAESSIDLPVLPEWSDFNERLDELAGFGADLAFLGSLARDIQAERSDERAAEVNKALGKYYSLITQDDAAIRVSVHMTAQRISYDLVDSSDRPAVPVLNQAAINALSLAVLFAQSEGQACTDSWELVTLDDPVQSLDADKQTGLSRAIEELANGCSVLVGTVPGQLSHRIQDYVSNRRHIVILGPWTQAGGASIESEVDR